MTDGTASSRPGPDLADPVRQALRRLAKTVTIVTCRHEDVAYAMAATAVTEVSLDPPSMLICINRAASLHGPLCAGADFCINVLHRAQIGIAAHCGGAKGESRFQAGDWETLSGVPVLRNAQANFVCSNAQATPFGTHAIFVGRVVAALVRDDADPLVYMDGRYRRVGGAVTLP